MEELLQTEREYVRALGYVVEHYIPQLERPDVPQDLRGQRGSIFGNLEKLRDFHQHHFLQELELCLKEPFCVGRCFLKHVSALSTKPASSYKICMYCCFKEPRNQYSYNERTIQLKNKCMSWSHFTPK